MKNGGLKDKRAGGGLPLVFSMSVDTTVVEFPRAAYAQHGPNFPPQPTYAIFHMENLTLQVQPIFP